MRRNLIGEIVLTVILLSLLTGISGAAPACVADDGTAFFCGATVTKSCTLNGSMICSSGHGLIIGADNITIDGDGYVLDGVAPGICTWGDRSGIYNKGHDDAVIKNLEIKGFCNGIYFDYSCRNTVENCDIHHNGNVTSPSATHGIKMQYISNSTIRNNSIHDQIAYMDPNPGCEDGGNGLFLYQGWHNNIIENKFYNNTKAGMLIKMMPKYWNISHNHLWGNGQGGIILRCCSCNFNLIEYNNASDNYGSGIFIGGNDNTIRYNTVRNNRDGGPYYEDPLGSHGYGIHIGRSDGSLNNTLISNTVCENDYLDILVVAGVTGNTGYENTCSTTCNYNDDGATNCTYSCSTPQLLGDLNCDGIVTPADAVIALQMAARGEYLPDADANCDDKVTSLDALLILQTAARM
jgi:parallel beta-helix repeat protein